MVVTTNVFYEFWQHSQFVQFATSSDVIEKCCFIIEYSCHSSNSWLKRKVRESNIINIKNNLNIMNAKIWKTVIDIVITILTAIATTITTTSCTVGF